MRPKLYVVTIGAIAGIFAGRHFEVGTLWTFGLVIVGMFSGLFLYVLLTKRSGV